VLGQLLGSETRASILARLYPDPEVELHLNELIRQTGFSPRAVQQEVERLVEAGLLRERRSGNRRYLRAEVHHPAFRPLADLVRVTAGAAAELKRILDKDQRIRLVLMFGSMAHGRERANSDIDLLVVADIGLRDLLTVLRPAQDALGRPINPVLMSPAEFRERLSSGEHFLTRVLESAPMVLVGSLDGDFARMVRKPVARTPQDKQ
jgi:predicted nucleotidyltransferase